MDHATLTDNTGRKADFRNVVLILTSNAGSREMSTNAIGFADGAAATSRSGAAARGGEQVEDGHREGLQPRVPQPPRRHHHFRALDRGDGEASSRSSCAARRSARGASRRDCADPGRASLAGDEGLRFQVRRPPARACRAERGPRPAHRRILFGQLEHGGTVTIGVADDHLSFGYEPRQRDKSRCEEASGSRPGSGSFSRDFPGACSPDPVPAAWSAGRIAGCLV